MWNPFSRTIPSERGDITINRMGPLRVAVGGCGQTSAYTHAMWSDALDRLGHAGAAPAVRAVLMLGLGAGGEIRQLYERFPGAGITAVEYDPAMIALARELALYKPYPEPAILQGDAAELVPAMAGRYDLILLDLFDGPEPSPLCTEPKFMESLARLLSPQGALLINVYRRAEYLALASRMYEHCEQWQFQNNHLALCRREVFLIK
jgi:spermidine synthase